MTDSTVWPDLPLTPFQAAQWHAARRERLALEYVRSMLAGPMAYLWEDEPAKLADLAVKHADALVARLAEPNS